MARPDRDASDPNSRAPRPNPDAEDNPRADNDSRSDVPKKDLLDDIDSVKEVLDKAGFAMRLIKSNREIKQIIKKLGLKLSRGKIDEDTIYEEFKKLLDNTKFGQRPSSEIAADLARYQKNNAEFKDNIRDLMQEIQRVSQAKLGREIDAGEARDLAVALVYSDEAFLRGQYDLNEIDRRLTRFIDVQDDEAEPDGMTNLGGQVGRFQQDLLQWFAANGVDVGANAMQKHLREIEKGIADIDMIKQQYRDRVFSNKYAGFADRFKEGMDVTDVALEYQQAVSRLLERNMADIRIDDPLVTKAMQFIDPSSGKARPMAGWEFEQMIREDPSWQKTDNAASQYARLGSSILRSFGFEG